MHGTFLFLIRTSENCDNINKKADEAISAFQEYENAHRPVNVVFPDDLPFSKTNQNLIQGYYDAKTDKVVVVGSNTPVNEVSKVAIHEVAHRGMLRMAKELGGQKELFQVLSNSKEQLIKKLPELLKRRTTGRMKIPIKIKGFIPEVRRLSLERLKETQAIKTRIGNLNKLDISNQAVIQFEKIKPIKAQKIEEINKLSPIRLSKIICGTPIIYLY
jgi:hypothetical protein